MFGFVSLLASLCPRISGKFLKDDESVSAALQAATSQVGTRVHRCTHAWKHARRDACIRASVRVCICSVYAIYCLFFIIASIPLLHLFHLCMCASMHACIHACIHPHALTPPQLLKTRTNRLAARMHAGLVGCAHLCVCVCVRACGRVCNYLVAVRVCVFACVCVRARSLARVHLLGCCACVYVCLCVCARARAITWLWVHVRVCSLVGGLRCGCGYDVQVGSKGLDVRPVVHMLLAAAK